MHISRCISITYDHFEWASTTIKFSVNNGTSKTVCQGSVGSEPWELILVSSSLIDRLHDFVPSLPIHCLEQATRNNFLLWISSLLYLDGYDEVRQNVYFIVDLGLSFCLPTTLFSTSQVWLLIIINTV